MKLIHVIKGETEKMRDGGETMRGGLKRERGETMRASLKRGREREKEGQNKSWKARARKNILWPLGQDQG